MTAFFRRAALATAGALALAPAAHAHHSYTSFDPRYVTLTGTVKDYQYTSPHIWTDIVVHQPDGKDVGWGLETGSPASNRPSGWVPHLLKPGDKVTAVIHPKRDGSLAGSVVSITLPDGRTLKMGDLVVHPPGRDGPPRP